MLILLLAFGVVVAGLCLGVALWFEARTRPLRADDWLAEGGLRR